MLACLDRLGGDSAPAYLPAYLGWLTGWSHVSCLPAALVDWQVLEPLLSRICSLSGWSHDPCLLALAEKL